LPAKPYDEGARGDWRRIVDRAKVTGIYGQRVLLKGIFGEARHLVEDVETVVTLVDAVSLAGLALETRHAGLTTVTVGDAHLPRDVTNAVSHAARLVDGLVISRSYELGQGASEHTLKLPAFGFRTSAGLTDREPERLKISRLEPRKSTAR